MKLHPKYKPFINHTGRYTIITGGRGSGKSFAVAQFIVKLSFEAGHKIVVMRFSSKSSKNSTIAEVKKQIVDLDVENYFTVLADKITNNFSGSEIYFDGLRGNTSANTARNKGREGVTTYIFEEAEEFTDEEEVDKIDEGLRIDNGLPLRMIFVLNPTTKEHWIYKRFFLENGVADGFNGISEFKDVAYDDGTPETVCYVHTTYLDNKYLKPSTRKIYERHKIYKPEYYNHVILGGWLDRAEGVIFKNWEYGDFPDDEDTFFGADFGYKNDPSTLIEVFIDKKNETIYLKEHLYALPDVRTGTGLGTNELAKVFKKTAKDRLIVADSAEGRLIDEIKAQGVNIKQCRKGAGSVKQGIKLIQDYKLIVDRNSKNLADELNYYCWKDSGEQPIDKYNHLIDAARYVITDRLKTSDGVYFIY